MCMYVLMLRLELSMGMLQNLFVEKSAGSNYVIS
jgi:hypothetical protein